MILSVLGASGGEIIPYASPANSPSEDLFGIQVLSEPWPVTPNCTLECSMRNRILAMNDSIFLLDKDGRAYWAEVKHALSHCISQTEYNQLIEFENRDLQIRELKHASYSLLQQISTQNPALFEKSPY